MVAARVSEVLLKATVVHFLFQLVEAEHDLFGLGESFEAKLRLPRVDEVAHRYREVVVRAMA